jgi:hypothetical protein
MAKPCVYVESTVLSYLTAWPSPDEDTLVKQEWTKKWWEQQDRWCLFVSPVVFLEISEGDSIAAEERLVEARKLPSLPDHPKASALAARLFAEVPIPEKAKADAAHLAFAAFYRMDYLVTWNQTHLDNPQLRSKIDKIIREHELSPAEVLSPKKLMEKNHDK